MGFDNKYLEKVRKIGRKVVLPSDEIKGILESSIDFECVESVCDFGAGSLFWSEYFAEKLGGNRVDSTAINMGGGQNELNRKVFAIDSIYKTYRPKCVFSNIALNADIFSTLQQQRFDLIFVSDVFHHLDSVNLDKIFSAFCAHGAKFIIIKDIDATHRFGDLMNKAHDLLINGEKVHSIFPQKLQMRLESSGFKCRYFYLPKLWYPHFLLIAQRKI